MLLRRAESRTPAASCGCHQKRNDGIRVSFFVTWIESFSSGDGGACEHVTTRGQGEDLAVFFCAEVLDAG
jgi:hypothetical protein